MSDERIRIFMPVYWREKLVKVSVQSTLDTMASDGYDVDLIVLDNNSNAELRTWLKQRERECSPELCVVLFDENKGKTDAINWASDRFPRFDWFISCDSDIRHTVKGWPGLLTDCYKQIQKAGMVSVDYVNNGNHPMPGQPERYKVVVREQPYTFHYGGQVAGGCFLSDRWTWMHTKYKSSGVYGGIDGYYRLRVANHLNKKCGFIQGIKAEHLVDPPEYQDYIDWKLRVQGIIRKRGPTVDAATLGNEKGFYDK